MALDHALLDAIDDDPREAVFRTYEWAEPTLSLGYFQHMADVRSQPRWDRRPDRAPAERRRCALARS